MIQVGRWEISLLIWLIIEVQFGHSILGKDIDHTTILSVDQTNVDGEIFVQMDRDIVDNMIILNGILRAYFEVSFYKSHSKIEKTAENRGVIEAFL
jgi:hypothetical protein